MTAKKSEVKSVPKKRGVKPKGKVKIKWSPNFAYAIGLIATDGCLSKNKGHVDLTSKDFEQMENFKRALSIEITIGEKNYKNKHAYRIQIGDVLFYQFLELIGMTQAKSKTIGVVKIPKKYLFDFLRGCFDGDGSFYSYYDPRWKSSFMFYLTFASASTDFIDWLRKELQERIGVTGHISCAKNYSTHQLRYAKKESVEIIKKMYYNDKVICLSRKRKKIEEALKNKHS